MFSASIHRNGVSLKVENDFYKEYFLQHFEDWSRVPLFHFITWNNEGVSSSFDILFTTANRI